jgi:RNA polymerase sigma-70 factor (ECF subfamily)
MAILSLIPAYGSPTRRFEALIHRHYRTLYRSAYRWTRSIEDAEDLVQEVCIRAYPRLDELEQLDQPASWLTRVMYRLFVDLTRRHDRSRVDTMESGDLANLKCERPGPDEIAERSVNAERLARAWQRIDREKRALLAMHDIEGYTLAELTRITGLKEGTLKSRLHRSRVLLGRLLEQEAAVTRLKIGAGGKK